MLKHKLAYIVPTKDRPDDLRKLLESLRGQTRRPDQVLIVDGSDNEIKHVLEEFKDLALDYIRVRPPGLTRQRNAGKRALRPDITLVGYIDDDLVLEPGASERMLDFFGGAPAEVGGASFNIVNNVSYKCNLFTKIFMTNDGRKGVILPSGFNVILAPVEKDTQVEWLCGGATVWKREVIDKYDYDEFFGGYGHFDDLDFSARAGLENKLYVLKDAKAAHYPKPLQIEKRCNLFVLDVIFRWYFVKKYPRRFSRFKCLWATLGLTMFYFLCGLIGRNRAALLNAKGYTIGLYRVLTGNMSIDKIKNIK